MSYLRMFNLWLFGALHRWASPPSGLLVASRPTERGQSTVEYALVLVGVGALATFVFKWLAGSGLLEELFGSIINKLIAR